MRIATLAGLALCLLAAGCGGIGGGGGGDGTADGPLAWGVLFLPTDGDDEMIVGLRNEDTDGTTVTLQGYKPDGTPYSAPIVVTLDGLDEERIRVGNAIGGGAPEGGWISVLTPSRRVEVYWTTHLPGKLAEEATRAFPAPEPIPSPYLMGLTATPETDTIQITNPTGLAILVAVTAYREPGGDPLDPPIASTPAPIALAPFETKLFTPDGLSGIGGFVGSFQFASPDPFLGGTREDLAFDTGRAQVSIETRLVEVSVNFGRDVGVGLGEVDTFWDFAMVARNDRDEPQTFTITQFRDEFGSLIPSPITVLLDSFESRVITTLDEPLSDFLPFVLTAAGLQRLWMEVSVPAGMDLTFRQFDPVAFEANMTQRPVKIGHVFTVMDVRPQPIVGLGIRTTISLVNPNTVAMEVTPEVQIAEPEGFDGTGVLFPPVILPPRTRVDWTPDGAVYVDRDGEPVDFVSIRFFSPSPFYVTGWRERRTGPDGLILMLSPQVIRNLEEEND
jgi:hypothetical protein